MIPFMDLIDTLWNVKEEDVKRHQKRHHRDLIDTLWNVKMLFSGQKMRLPRI